MKRFAVHRRWVSVLLFYGSFAFSQGVAVTGRVEVVRADSTGKSHDGESVVLWLTPLTDTAALAPDPSPRAHPLIQKNKSFDPHVLVVPVGSVVAFPNHDPFFHNVFSLFEGKRFDLGLYEAGSTRDVHFDKPGISYIFCNIHPEMSAVVIALNTPYYGISDERGQVVIPHVPSGHYTLRIWYEAGLPETLKGLTRDIAVSEGAATLGVLRIREAALPRGHKNLYGKDYEPPTADNPAYVHP